MNDITSTLAALIKRQAEADKRLYADKSRSAADHQYFMGAHDAVDMLARALAETGMVDRSEFLAACGLNH